MRSSRRTIACKINYFFWTEQIPAFGRDIKIGYFCTMNRQPLISVITVTFNAGATLPATMESVAAQSCHDYEHIIMDGVSKDSTLEIARQLSTSRTRVVSSPDNGIYDAMNKALRVATGKYVLFLNAGDTFYDSGTLKRYAEAAGQNPDIIYGQTVLADSCGNIVGPRHLQAPERLDLNSFKQGMTICHQAFMVKRSIAPLYDTAYRLSADYDWCIRCIDASGQNHVYLGEPPVIKYLREGMTTANHKASLKERFKIMCKHYGWLPTVARHARFALRYMVRQRKAVNNQ